MLRLTPASEAEGRRFEFCLGHHSLSYVHRENRLGSGSMSEYGCYVKPLPGPAAAVLVGLTFFGETPDPLTIIGCILIVGAGVVTARTEAHPAKSSSTARDAPLVDRRTNNVAARTARCPDQSAR